MNSSLSLTFKAAMLTCFVIAGGQAAHTQGKAQAKKVGYATVQPIIQAKCMSCHNDARHPEAVNLSSYEKLMKSGEHGSIVMARHPEKSKLFLYVNGAKQPRMPFQMAPLSKKEIATIKAWILAGAQR
jgi:uncharacterized membrane protein